MKYKIIYSSHFSAQLKKWLKKKPKLIGILMNALILLAEFPPASSLKVHKLSGSLKEQWAFSLTYGLRVIYERKGNEIRLLNIGSHDEVY